MCSKKHTDLSVVIITEIIHRCHQRHDNPLRQRKTVVTPAIYKALLYHFTVHCAHRYPVRLYDLEQADISFMPTGGAPKYDRMPQSYGGERFLTRQGIEDWEIRQWYASWGLQIYTGIPSEKDGARWHDLEFTYQAICDAPDAVLACIETLVSVVANPLLTITKSGGLRFSCRVPHHLHPNTAAERFYIYKDTLTPENQYQRDVYLEIRGKEGHSAWDARNEILSGKLLDPPVIAKEVLFAAVDALQEELHESRLETTPTTDVILSLPSLGSYKLDLAKEAFLKREFTYLRQENDLHHWTQHTTESNHTDVLLWEHNNTIWIRATNPDIGLPTADTPITAIWDDTGILPPVSEIEPPVSDKVLAVREGKLSPLAIKRPDPGLKKPEKDCETLSDNSEQIQQVFDSKARIIGLIAADTGVRNNYAIETHLLKAGPTRFSAHFPVVEEAIRLFDRENLPSIARYRTHKFAGVQVKDIPVDSRMATPFQHGNMCEDWERATSLVEKGMDPSETLCPKCPVNAECQQRGYLSQFAILQRANTQVFGNSQAFVNPNETTPIKHVFEPINDTERLSIIDEVKAERLFVEGKVSNDTLKTWEANWQGSALGSYAQALRNVLETRNEPDDLLVKRIRTVTHAFEHLEKEIIKQMRQVNIKGRVIEKKIIDEETGSELAHYAVLFERDVSAHIPIDKTAAEKLIAKGLPVIQPKSSIHPNTDTKIAISIEQAIRLGILDISTPEKIRELPQTYQNPEWTLWHQLKRFFAHYVRDTDAPMIWYNKNNLRFWMPSMLHPNIKRLLLISSTLSEQDLRRTFPVEKIEVAHVKPLLWKEGNQVFQIRTGVYSRNNLLDYNSAWDVIGLSKIGKRFVHRICTEIYREPNVNHVVITYGPIIAQLEHLKEKGNVRFTSDRNNLSKLEAAFKAAQVVWIVGTPFWQPGELWRYAQILYGNDEEPLCYEADTDFHYYKDPRIQRVYIQKVSRLITDIIGRAGLNRLPNKKVVLISSLQFPNITDRPETLLFDWEDFEIAGSLDKLAETIAKRQQFEKERDNLTAECSREKVEHVLGCSSRQANRILQQLRGGNIPRVTYREQILSLLKDSEKKTSEIIEAISGNPTSIKNELARLIKTNEIIKIRRGVYALPD